MDFRSVFHKKLNEIQDDVLVLGGLVGDAIQRSTDALTTRDLALAQRIVAGDKRINQLRFDIEEKCVQLIATQQPLASDLRVLVAVLNIITEMERIGDYAVGISKITIMIGDEPPLKPLVDIPRMAEKTVDMLKRSLDAFVARDAETATGITAEDDVVDDLYDKIFKELLGFMMKDGETVTRATRLIWVAHDLERSADRVTNICERVVFVVTGKMEEI
jgi:phosphate transport system protein